MKLNNKGQMIVLDVLFAIALIILVFLLVFKVSEVEIYKSNSQRQVEKLNRIGDLSYYSLMNNAKNGCYVVDSQNRFFIPGTINSLSPTITKADLAIPLDYNCNLAISGTTTGCTDTVPAIGDIYVVDFNISTCNNLSKSQYLGCVKSSCGLLTNQTGTLKIWRAE